MFEAFALILNNIKLVLVKLFNDQVTRKLQNILQLSFCFTISHPFKYLQYEYQWLNLDDNFLPNYLHLCPKSRN